MAKVLYDAEYALQMLHQGITLEFSFLETEDEWYHVAGLGVSDDGCAFVSLRTMNADDRWENLLVAVRRGDSFREAQ